MVNIFAIAYAVLKTLVALGVGTIYWWMTGGHESSLLVGMVLGFAAGIWIIDDFDRVF
jgi:positive regulator of sigma E activity